MVISRFPAWLLHTIQQHPRRFFFLALLAAALPLILLAEPANSHVTWATKTQTTYKRPSFESYNKLQDAVAPKHKAWLQYLHAVQGEQGRQAYEREASLFYDGASFRQGAVQALWDGASDPALEGWFVASLTNASSEGFTDRIQLLKEASPQDFATPKSLANHMGKLSGDYLSTAGKQLSISKRFMDQLPGGSLQKSIKHQNNPFKELFENTSSQQFVVWLLVLFLFVNFYVNLQAYWILWTIQQEEDLETLNAKLDEEAIKAQKKITDQALTSALLRPGSTFAKQKRTELTSLATRALYEKRIEAYEIYLYQQVERTEARAEETTEEQNVKRCIKCCKRLRGNRLHLPPLEPLTKAVIGKVVIDDIRFLKDVATYYWESPEERRKLVDKYRNKVLDLEWQLLFLPENLAQQWQGLMVIAMFSLFECFLRISALWAFGVALYERLQATRALMQFSADGRKILDKMQQIPRPLLGRMPNVKAFLDFEKGQNSIRTTLKDKPTRGASWYMSFPFQFVVPDTSYLHALSAKGKKRKEETTLWIHALLEYYSFCYAMHQLQEHEEADNSNRSLPQQGASEIKRPIMQGSFEDFNAKKDDEASDQQHLQHYHLGYSSVSMLLGDPEASSNYLKNAFQHMTYTSITGLARSDDATVTIPDHVFFFDGRREKDNSRLWAIYRYAQLHPDKRVLVLADQPFTEQGNYTPMMASAYAHALTKLDNVTAVIATSDESIYGFIGRNDAIELLTTESYAQNDEPLRIKPGRYNRSSHYAQLLDKAEVPFQVRKELVRAETNAPAFLREGNLSTSRTLHATLLGLLLLLLAVFALLFSYSRRKPETE